MLQAPIAPANPIEIFIISPIVWDAIAHHVGSPGRRFSATHDT